MATTRSFKEGITKATFVVKKAKSPTPEGFNLVVSIFWEVKEEI